MISNLKRHYETKHRNFEETFPQNSEVRTTKINALKCTHTHTHSIVISNIWLLQVTRGKREEKNRKKKWVDVINSQI